jgi:hypothetical protein
LARRSIDQIERNEHLDQRAWITVYTAKIVKPLVLDEIPAVTLHMTNSGKTPALKLHVTGFVAIAGHADLSRRDSEPLGHPTEGVIGPNGGADSTIDMRFPITEQTQLDSVTTNESAYLYVIGTISYVDIFEKKNSHRTHFCYKWNEKQAPTDNHFFMWSGETGNDAN